MFDLISFESLGLPEHREPDVDPAHPDSGNDYLNECVDLLDRVGIPEGQAFFARAIPLAPTSTGINRAIGIAKTPIDPHIETDEFGIAKGSFPAMLTVAHTFTGLDPINGMIQRQFQIAVPFGVARQDPETNEPMFVTGTPLSSDTKTHLPTADLLLRDLDLSEIADDRAVLDATPIAKCSEATIRASMVIVSQAG